MNPAFANTTQPRGVADENASTAEIVDTERFADGRALCAHIDACLDGKHGAGRREPVLRLHDFETKKLLRERYACDIYENMRRPTTVRIHGRLPALATDEGAGMRKQ